MMATAISYGLGLVVYIVLGRGPMALPIPWSTLAQTSFAAAVMALVLSRLPSPGGVVELAMKARLGAAIYGIIAYPLDIGGLRSRAAGALRLLRARTAT